MPFRLLVPANQVQTKQKVQPQDNRDFLQKAGDIVSSVFPGKQMGEALGTDIYAGGRLLRGDIKGAKEALASQPSPTKVLGEGIETVGLVGGLVAGVPKTILGTAAQFGGLGALTAGGGSLAKGKGLKKSTMNALKGGAIEAITGGALATLAKYVAPVGSQILGAETGAGASSIKTAAGGGEDFVKAMRGEITPEETINNLQDAFVQLQQNRAIEYQKQLQKIAESNQQLDISPIHEELKKQLNNFKVAIDENGLLDFSRSPIRFNKPAQNDIQQIYETMKNWGTQAGDRTPIGVDTLKRAFSDLYSDSSNVRSFIQAIKSTTRDILNKNVTGYEKMTSQYTKISELLDDIRSAIGVGGKAKADTVFTKVTSALKSDKDFRLQMLSELENGSGQKLIDAIAGHNLSKWIPSGLIGKGMDVGMASSILYHVFHPAMIPAILTTSPRVVGEFLNAMGVTGRFIEPILSAIDVLKIGRSAITEFIGKGASD